VRFWSFKTINLKKSVPFVAVIVITLVIALLSQGPSLVLFAGFVVYALSGYAMAAYGALRRRRRPAPS